MGARSNAPVMVIPMSAETGPFHGTWWFNPQLSKMCIPAPHSWVQEIHAGKEEVTVREEIVRANGTELSMRVKARLDGADYPVEGSPTVDTIAYTRTDPHTIFGVGKKDGIVALTQTVRADPEQGTLTLIYKYLMGEETIAHGIAVFQSALESSVSAPARQDLRTSRLRYSFASLSFLVEAVASSSAVFRPFSLQLYQRLARQFFSWRG
jgi:hypothetical protein